MENKFHYPLPRDEVKSIREAIKKIRFQNKEHLYVFKNGRQIRRFIGEFNNVNIPSENLFNLKDSTVIHNHPSGTAFSFDDVISAVNYDLKELYVVTNYYIYSIKRPENGWNVNFEEESVQKALNSCEKSSREVLEKNVAQFQIKNEEKDILFFDFLWVFFFNMFNIEYAKKEHPKNSF